MAKRGKEKFNVDDLLNSLFPSENLIDLFEQRIKELDIPATSALEILDIEYRALQGILHGTSKRVDVTNFIKLGSFLKLPKDKVVELYFKALGKHFPDTIAYPKDKMDFINANFDLANLKRAGFIDTITNYREIEDKINNLFGFKTIFQYSLPEKTVAFSAGIVQPKEVQTRGFWINSAIALLNEINNPYLYDKSALIKYFPKIRWHTKNVEHGLLSVIRDLYQLGITVLYQASLPSLHLKGATVDVNDKPCIVLTDYKGFYSTLWHTLCHELSHVLFDFQEIKKNTYHISDEDPQDLAVSEKEREADDFAREFLLSKDKLASIKAHIGNKKFITQYAEQNDVHPSFIYTYYAYDNDKADPKAWARAKSNNPSFESFVKKIENPWTDTKSIKECVRSLKKTHIYN